MTAAVLLVVGLAVVGCVAYVIVRLIEERDEVTAAWADEVFISAGLNAEVEQLREDFAALGRHLGEVLRDHAECPVPVTPAPDVIDDAWLELLVTGAGGTS